MEHGGDDVATESHDPSPKAARPRLRRWLQFRLRTLLGAVLLICAALAWWVWYTREEPSSALLPPGTGPWTLLSEPGEKVWRELNKPTQWQFQNTTLSDAATYI